MSHARMVAVLLAGALFGFGLSYSTMTTPEVVLSFLQGRDMGLLLVMVGAIAVTLVAYQFLPAWLGKPMLSETFGRHVAVLERDTVIGATLFGIGWGLCGVCPGPALAGLGGGNVDLLWAVGGILAGAWLQGVTTRPSA